VIFLACASTTLSFAVYSNSIHKKHFKDKGTGKLGESFVALVLAAILFGISGLLLVNSVDELVSVVCGGVCVRVFFYPSSRSFLFCVCVCLSLAPPPFSLSLSLPLALSLARSLFRCHVLSCVDLVRKNPLGELVRC
jgi:hypothetical protein